MKTTEQDWIEYFHTGGDWIWIDGVISRIFEDYIKTSKAIIRKFNQS